MTEMAKPIFTIMKGGSPPPDSDEPFNPFETLELDADSRKYLHIRVNNIVKTYEGGVENKTSHYTKLARCSKKYLSKTDFEKNFQANSGSIDYCMEDDKVYL